MTYNFILNQHHADITVNSCEYNPNAPVSLDKERFDYSKQNNNKIANPNYMGQAKPDLRAIEKQINHEPEKPKATLVECKTCKCKTYDDDIRRCSKCGKEVCSNCGTSADGQVFCEECWKEE
jgi:DNA polymerase II small subunit/DNA polymerase delta subunit B